MTEIHPHKYILAYPSNGPRPFEGYARSRQGLVSPNDGDETACSPKRILGKESAFLRSACGNDTYEFYFSGEGRQAAAAPILVHRDRERSREEKDKAPGVDLMVRKVSCGGSWCPECFRSRTVGKIVDRMSRMDWVSVRTLTLTLDRDQFEDGQQAYEVIKEKKAVAALIKNMKRSAEIHIIDWLWFAEWHADGFIHYHVIIEVQEQGNDAMIGQDIIHKYWPYGAIRESYIHDEEHWKRMTGYFEKRGYFERKKEHQSTLPEWARQYTQIIRRWGSMCKSYERKNKTMKNTKSESREGESSTMEDMVENEVKLITTKERKTYDVILSGCGQGTKLSVVSEGRKLPDIKITQPYKAVVKSIPGLEYKEKLGMCKTVTWRELEKILYDYEGDIESLEVQDFYEYMFGRAHDLLDGLAGGISK